MLRQDGSISLVLKQGTVINSECTRGVSLPRGMQIECFKVAKPKGSTRVQAEKNVGNVLFRRCAMLSAQPEHLWASLAVPILALQQFSCNADAHGLSAMPRQPNHGQIENSWNGPRGAMPQVLKPLAPGDELNRLFQLSLCCTES